MLLNVILMISIWHPHLIRNLSTWHLQVIKKWSFWHIHVIYMGSTCYLHDIHMSSTFHLYGIYIKVLSICCLHVIPCSPSSVNFHHEHHVVPRDFLIVRRWKDNLQRTDHLISWPSKPTRTARLGPHSTAQTMIIIYFGGPCM